MNPIVEYIAARMKEPSTWAGVASILIAFKVLPNDPSVISTLTTAGVAVGGILAAIFPEVQKLTASEDANIHDFGSSIAVSGNLAVVATLTSLYPASTVFLAAVALGERLRPAQIAGLGLATVAVVMIVLGR